MMKFLLVSCLIVAVLAVGASSQVQVCEPGETTITFCGPCTCNDEGTGVNCKHAWCYTPELRATKGGRRFARGFGGSRRSMSRGAGARCIPGQMVKVDCNWCYCTSPGVLGPCTLVAC